MILTVLRIFGQLYKKRSRVNNRRMHFLSITHSSWIYVRLQIVRNVDSLRPSGMPCQAHLSIYDTTQYFLLTLALLMSSRAVGCSSALSLRVRTSIRSSTSRTWFCSTAFTLSLNSYTNNVSEQDLSDAQTIRTVKKAG